MDWIDEKIEKLRNRIRNLSLKQALAVYLLLAVLAAFLCSFLIQQICFWAENRIFARYGMKLHQDRGIVDIYYMGQNAAVWRLTETEQDQIFILQLVSDLSPWICMAVWMVIAAVLFYYKRMKAPFDILKKGADEMGRKNLDFQIYYDSADEMGQLCRTFEQMRSAIVSDREELWQRIEDQKEINAAFAHDMRTPLTVLRGYAELLGRYVPEGKISEQKLADTLALMTRQLQRLEDYTKTMRHIRSFEEIEPVREQIRFRHLSERIREITDPLNEARGVEIRLTNRQEQKNGRRVQENESQDQENTNLWLDVSLFLEVFENLLSNALRYAVEQVQITLEWDESSGYLRLYVYDDGQGFDIEELYTVSEPYFRGEKSLADGQGQEPEKEHFGIGLHICRVLAEKHGGSLNLANSIDGGALASVSFFCRNS